MSRAAPRCLTLALATAVWLPGPVRGQQTEQELVQHLDSLLPLLEQAKMDADVAHEALRRALELEQPTEAVEVGPIHLLVFPGQAETARDVVGTVWDRDFAWFVDRSPSLDRARIFFQWATNQQPYTSPSSNVRVVDGGRWRSRAYMEGSVQLAISESIDLDLQGTRLQQEWGVTSVRPPRDPQDLYRRLVVAPSVAVRECMAGGGEPCLVALGLVDDGYSIDDWYSPEERRLLVVGQASRFRGQAEGSRACFDGSLEACDRVIRSYADNFADVRWASPVVPEIRASMLRYALEQGGAGAWGRLLDHAEDEPLKALEAASGMDGRALAQGWWRWLGESRPATHAGLGSLTLGALLWLFLLITFAARSTRWRLG